MEKRGPEQPDEPNLCDDGIWLRRDKTKYKGGDALIIIWPPRLKSVVTRLLRLKAERDLKKRASQRVQTPVLITKQDGAPITYKALATAWQLGVKRAGVAPAMFRDLRAKALTDKADRASMRAASGLGIHTTEAQTTSYLRRTRVRRIGAAARAKASR